MNIFFLISSVVAVAQAYALWVGDIVCWLVVAVVRFGVSCLLYGVRSLPSCYLLLRPWTWNCGHSSWTWISPCPSLPWHILPSSTSCCTTDYSYHTPAGVSSWALSLLLQTRLDLLPWPSRPLLHPWRLLLLRLNLLGILAPPHTLNPLAGIRSLLWLRGTSCRCFLVPLERGLLGFPRWLLSFVLVWALI